MIPFFIISAIVVSALVIWLIIDKDDHGTYEPSDWTNDEHC